VTEGEREEGGRDNRVMRCAMGQRVSRGALERTTHLRSVVAVPSARFFSIGIVYHNR